MQISLTIVSEDYHILKTPRVQAFESTLLVDLQANVETDLGGSASFVSGENFYTVSETLAVITNLTGGGGISETSGTATAIATATELGTIHQTTLDLVDAVVTITDDAGVAQYGGVKIYDLPKGAIQFIGAVVSGTLTGGVTGTITNTFAGGVSLGTATATTGATLTGTEADIMAEADVAAATAKVATVSAISVAPTNVDGTGTAKDVYLNFVIDDSATHTSGTAKYTGKIVLSWINLGEL